MDSGVMEITWKASAPVPKREKPARAQAVAIPAEMGKLRAALISIPNDADQSLAYEDWFRIVCGVHHATDGSDEGLELAREFSARSPKFDDDFLTSRVWPYVRSDRSGEVTTAASVFHMARIGGYTEDVSDDFDVVPDASPKPRPQQIVPYKEFCKELIPPHYVWHRVLQGGCVYGFTARWGDGKTAIALTVAFHVATGKALCGHLTEKSKVLYLCGENPADVRLRSHAAVKYFDIEDAEIADQIYFTMRPFPLDDPKALKSFITAAAPLGPFGLVVVDTGPAHTQAEQENDNREMHLLAMAMRDLIAPLGNPAVLALMHPAKSAARENLEPRGGGAFSGSIDGELCAWQEEKGLVEFFHRSKFRGPGFEPFCFRLETHDLEIMDNFGHATLTVVAVETTDEPVKKVKDKPSGKLQKDILRALQSLCGLGGSAPLEKLKEMIVPGMDITGKRDTRAQVFKRALEAMEGKWLRQLRTSEGDVVELIAGETK